MQFNTEKIQSSSAFLQEKMNCTEAEDKAVLQKETGI